MKKIFVSCFVIVLFASCVTYKGTVTSVPPQDEKIVKSGFVDYLKSKQRLSVVLRTPQAAANVTQNDPVGAFYSYLEKRLMQAGFDVRDRSLLNALLAGGTESYNDVAKKTNADIIIDITSFATVDKKIGKVNAGNVQYSSELQKHAEDHFLIQTAVFDFKLIRVDHGEAGAIMTLYFVPGGTYEFYCYDRTKYSWHKDYSLSEWWIKLRLKETSAHEAFADQLISILRGNL